MDFSHALSGPLARRECVINLAILLRKFGILKARRQKVVCGGQEDEQKIVVAIVTVTDRLALEIGGCLPHVESFCFFTFENSAFHFRKYGRLTNID